MSLPCTHTRCILTQYTRPPTRHPPETKRDLSRRGARLETRLCLAGHAVLWLLLSLLGNTLLSRRQDHVDVARGALVGVDATVGAVRASTLVHSLLHLNVSDGEGVGVDALGLDETRGEIVSHETREGKSWWSRQTSGPTTSVSFRGFSFI